MVILLITLHVIIACDVENFWQFASTVAALYGSMAVSKYG